PGALPSHDLGPVLAVPSTGASEGGASCVFPRSDRAGRRDRGLRQRGRRPRARGGAPGRWCLGYPFGSLGTTALLFLVVGVALLSLPAYFEEETSASQDRLARAALGLAAATAVLLALGSLLAVRANFHVYAENDRSVPTYVVVQYITFLIGNLGTAVAAVYATMQVTGIRERRR
ncbi:MAG TPA: hypothetical protein VG078_06230, partial [Acidimicrobiales bacterium]|nr:hypothetical protein [Acidimicrobiales bacterium]